MAPSGSCRRKGTGQTALRAALLARSGGGYISGSSSIVHGGSLRAITPCTILGPKHSRPHIWGGLEACGIMRKVSILAAGWCGPLRRPHLTRSGNGPDRRKRPKTAPPSGRADRLASVECLPVCLSHDLSVTLLLVSLDRHSNIRREDLVVDDSAKFRGSGLAAGAFCSTRHGLSFLDAGTQSA